MRVVEATGSSLELQAAVSARAVDQRQHAGARRARVAAEIDLGGTFTCERGAPVAAHQLS